MSRFNSTVQCVGYSQEELTNQQKDRLEAVLECFDNEALLALKCFRNLDTTSDEEAPSGTVSIFSMRARVDPNAIPESMFTVLAVSKINDREDMPNGYTDGYFTDSSKRGAFGDAVVQYAKLPPKLSIRSKVTKKEFDLWGGELGGPGSFVAVVSKMRENQRDKDYFLVAQGTAPLAVEEFKNELALKKPTFSDLLFDPEWRSKLAYMQNLARRNVCVNLYTTAQALGVPIRTSDMLSSYKAKAGHAWGTKAEPQWVQHVSTILQSVYRGSPVAAIYHGVVPKEHCQALDDQTFFVVGNPYNGITTFPITRNIKIVGVPANTGRAMPAENLDGKEQEMKSRASGVTWEGQETYEHHTDLHPSAFNPVDSKFRASMKGAGWNAEHHTGVMVPLLVKLWNPQLKRG